MSDKKYHHVTFNPMMEGLKSVLENIDTNYQLIQIIPYTYYESVAVFIEHEASNA